MSDTKPETQDAAPIEIPVQATGWFANAPWWMISSGLHLVVVLAASLVYVEQLKEIVNPEPTVIISKTPVAGPPIADIRDIETIRGAPIKDDEILAKDQPVIWDPTAALGKHIESDDGIDGNTRRGESEKMLGYLWGGGDAFRARGDVKGPGVYDAMGIGGGAGRQGRFGNGPGGRQNLRVPGRGTGSTLETESAVTAALKWLARHQNEDGGWGAESFSHRCSGGRCSGAGERDFDAGVAGLSLLAFLGAGYTHLSRDEFEDPVDPSRKLKFGEVVRNAIKWMSTNQDPEGCLGPRTPKYMYNHTIAALALSEAYGMTGAVQVREPAQQAIDFLVASQNPGKGWRYSYKAGDNDTSVTGWAVMALKSAEMSGLQFPKTAYDGALAWIREATDNGGYYRTGYNAAGTGKVFVPGKNEAWDHHEAMSAVAVMSRIFMQKDRKDPTLTAAALLTNDLPEWKAHKIDFYYWYYASLALFQLDGPTGPTWRKWNEPMKNALVPHQAVRRDGCKNGSWDPEVDRWGFEGGRVYATAINCLTLEVYYRYQSVFGVAGSGK